MRKHFLILMLLTLLPLAGWANEPQPYTSSPEGITFKKANGDVINIGDPMLTYDGTSRELPTPKAINGTDITLDILNLAWSYVDGATETPINKNNAGKFMYTNAGTYKISFDLNEELGTGTTHHTATWVVNQKPVTVSAKLKANQSVIYGDAFTNSKFEAVFTGFEAADLNSGTPKSGVMTGTVTEFLTDYTQGANAGNNAYYIRPIITSLTSKNYTFKVAETDGMFTVKAKNIVDDPNKFTFSFSELVYNAKNQTPTITVKDVVLNKEATFTAEFFTNTECTNAFTYDVYAFTAYPDATSNTEYANGTVDVLYETSNYAIVKVKENSVEGWAGKIFKVNKVANATADTRYQLYENEAAIDVWVKLGTKTAATTLNHKDAAPYYVKIKGSGNYGGNAITKSFKIKQKALAITTQNQKITYTGVVLKMDNDKITYEGLEEADKAVDTNSQKVNKPAENDVFAETGISIKVKTAKPVTFVGEGSDYKLQAYAVKTTGTDPNTVETPINDVTKIFKNYYVAYFYDGVLTVDPAELTFTLKDQEVQYGTESNLKPGVSYTPTTDFADYLTVTGFVDGDAVVTYPTLKVAATETTANSSLYKITADFTNVALKHTDGEDNVTVVPFNNYKLKNTSKTTSILSLIKGSINVRPIDASNIYGAPQASLTVNVSTANENVATAAAEILKKAVVIAETAKDNTTKYPNAGKYVMSLDLTKLADDDDYKALIKNYNIAPFTGEYTIAQRQLTNIVVYNQSLNKGDKIANLVKSEKTVEFTAAAVDGVEYPLTPDDYEQLQSEYNFVLTDVTYGGTNNDELAGYAANKTNGVIGITYVDANNKFKNFIAPKNNTTEISLGTTAVTGKYTLGKLTISDKVANLVLARVAIPNTEAVAAQTSEETTSANTAYNLIKANSGNKVTKVTFTLPNHTMKAETWYSWVLPFATTVREISQAFGYAVVDILGEDGASSADDVKFKLHMGDIKANQPFILKVYKDIKPEEFTDANTTIKFDNVTILKDATATKNAPEVTDANGNKFIGTYSGKYGLESNEYLFRLGVNNYSQGGAGSQIRPLGAYIQFATPSNAHTIYIEEPDGSTTAISSIAADGEMIPAEGWYTLNGVKLQGAPTEKGVYINNGKKVVVK